MIGNLHRWSAIFANARDPYQLSLTHLIRPLLIGTALLLTNAQSALANNSAQVIVYGSTPGGFCAAIAAAREGASVILLEPTDHVGGMSTGGLSHCDSNQMVRSTLLGLFDEWHRRVVKDYVDRGLPAPYDPVKKDQSRWTFEPHVAKRVTMKMLEEAGVRVLTQRYLTSVTKQGPRITSLVTKNGTFSARVFVDGTYEGDLMAAAGVDWTIGREGRKDYDESFAGKQYPKQTLNIDGFDDEGRPLPLVTTAERGIEEVGDGNVMTYSFRLCLTGNVDNRIPMPEPANYDPGRFEIVRRALRAGEKRIGFDLYPLPGNKLDGNNSIGGQFSIGLIGGGRGWHSADEAGRSEIWEAHKQYTLEFIHFLKTDPVVPDELPATIPAPDAASQTRYPARDSIGASDKSLSWRGHFDDVLSMTTVFVIKTGALGDVLRTTSILPGLKARFPDLQVTWLTAAAAKPLVDRHPLIDRVITCNPKDEATVTAVQNEFAETTWDWLLSLDDEPPLCALAAALDCKRLSGATLDQDGNRVYTDDVEPWFGMGLLARDGKQIADARKIDNQRTHPAIFADMLGIEPGRTAMPLPKSATETAKAFARQHGLFADRLVVGLNTGAGGRWTSKGLPPARVAEYASQLAATEQRAIDFLVLGGPDERQRNDEILALISGLEAAGNGKVRAIDAGTDNDLPTFASIIGLCDLLLTSDSLALHLGIATDTPIVSFFAPTSAAEIELYGLGEKVISTAGDYCSYRPDADNSSLTAERLIAATQSVLATTTQQSTVRRPVAADS